MKLQCGNKQLDLTHPVVMGILNITPDSFSDGGQLFGSGAEHIAHCLRIAEKMIVDGAAVLDIGGESTRPGAVAVSSEEEMARVLPVVEALHRNLDVIISVDTSNPELMIEAAKCGAGLINDVRALQRDGALQAAAGTGLPVCLMHMQGQPGNMQDDPYYSNVVSDVENWLLARVDACIHAGIAQEKLLLDPGFGFGKTLEHNLSLLKHLDQLAALPYPLLVGLSRKSIAGKLTGRLIAERLPASLALAQLALDRGARILRVHDVAETADMLKIWRTVKEFSR
ncbi:MAG TPA: dihydropteroate synthase [Pseudomonadales bacterium]|nr:dihydropteroate synthase [Pseudomonadales bacterium]